MADTFSSAYRVRMAIHVLPATRFAHVATMLGPKKSVNGAVDLARSHGAPGVEAIPLDNGTAKVDLTMAFVGTRGLFQRAGFTKVADADSVTGGFRRVVMRRSWA
jgi:hypothetical protein